jgi:hypothetical protein
MRIWRKNIEQYLYEIGCEVVHCNELVQNRVEWRDFMNMVV